MKKFLLIVMSLLLVLAVGCGSTEPEAPAVTETDWYTTLSPQGGEAEPLGAVVYFPVMSAEELPSAVESLPVLDFGGTEYYLIVPRYVGDTVTVAQLALDEQSGEIVKAGGDSQYEGAFILCCNPSDIFPNAAVTLRHGEETVTFSPYISLMDGSAVTDERAPLCEWAE